MRSRPARLIFGATALVASAAAGFFLIDSERQIAGMRKALRSFDLSAREATDALAEMRAAEAAYVGVGQGTAFWVPKVAATRDSAAATIATLRQQAAARIEARAALDEAASTLVEFGQADERARGYLESGEQLMAGDVIFTEAGETAATASRHVEAARLAEHQAVDADEAWRRRQEALALGGAAAVSLLAILVLIPGPRSGEAAGATSSERAAITVHDLPLRGIAHGVNAVDTWTAGSGQGRPVESSASQAAADRIKAGDRPAKAGHDEGGTSIPPYSSSRPAGPVLKAASHLCTEFGRVSDLDALNRLIERAADIMDATGLVVWLGSSDGAELRPALAHGYSPQIIARMPTVLRSGDNAASTAYRTGQLQIVRARGGSSSGAIVAPILAPDGCIGALSAEIRGGGEASESVQALATIFAAHLASVVGTMSAGQQPRAVTG